MNNHGNTALILAAYKGYPEIVELLLNKGADINTRGKEDLTALSSASKHGHTEIVKLLLAAFPPPT